MRPSRDWARPRGPGVTSRPLILNAGRGRLIRTQGSRHAALASTQPMTARDHTSGPTLPPGVHAARGGRSACSASPPRVDPSGPEISARRRPHTAKHSRHAGWISAVRMWHRTIFGRRMAREQTRAIGSGCWVLCPGRVRAGVSRRLV
jgi:hypothetical protein